MESTNLEINSWLPWECDNMTQLNWQQIEFSPCQLISYTCFVYFVSDLRFVIHLLLLKIKPASQLLVKRVNLRSLLVCCHRIFCVCHLLKLGTKCQETDCQWVTQACRRLEIKCGSTSTEIRMDGALGTTSHSDFKSPIGNGLVETMTHYFSVTLAEV